MARNVWYLELPFQIPPFDESDLKPDGIKLYYADRSVMVEVDIQGIDLLNCIDPIGI